MHTRMEEQGVQTRHEPFSLLSAEDDDKLICCRPRWPAREQSGQGQGKRLFEDVGLVDACCCAGYLYEFHGMRTQVVDLGA